MRFWFKAILAIVLAGLCGLFSDWLGLRPSYTTLCGDPHGGVCLREWISATGGWIAVAAAIPTIFYLSRQTSAAVKANQNNAKMTLRREIALANRAKSRATFIEMNAISLSDATDYPEIGFAAKPLNYEETNRKLDVVSQLLNDPAFDKFEAEIEYPAPYSIEFLRLQHTLLREKLASHTGEAPTEEDLISVFEFARICAEYARDCRLSAGSFLDEAEEMTGHKGEVSPEG